MKMVRRAALVAVTLMLATAGAVLVSASPAQAAQTCPATDPGFQIGGGMGGAEGVETGTLTGTAGNGLQTLTCYYRGRHWVAPNGAGVSYVGYCYWHKEWYLIGGWTGRKNVTC
ncbi:hypothetical protein [Luedemannella helvata]|uniref:Uncharacterized protein n=1 Tax=Luedemannella helvata TaxID=349315 RepID=A0ABP4VXU4_9ACTN